MNCLQRLLNLQTNHKSVTYFHKLFSQYQNDQSLVQKIDAVNAELSSFFGEQHITENTCSPTNFPQLQTQQDCQQIQQNATNQQLELNLNKLSHVNDGGQISMVDVSSKVETSRVAVASAIVVLGQEAFEQVQQNLLKKGDVLSVAKIAGIMGAKQTSQLIPLCHNIIINKVNVETLLDAKQQSVRIECEVRTKGSTGVEMEALTGASIAALTVYDMCKAVSKEIVIKEVQLESKHGGKSGDFVRQQQA
eukprot:TRINITY_DN5646_c1_g2_i1.p2 TRINITY_DN5646_c1_g2~~TRINITY_DN5646_c1_g2_i1.p2  ORF type:complete len:249 (-),score=29.33 TRINITY_DN5646_c1_g2_i1:171-917(-)